jgi:predicted small lipoprotein YifL
MNPTRACIMLAAVALLAACGNKGPLVLPAEVPPAETQPPEPASETPPPDPAPETPPPDPAPGTPLNGNG